MFNQNGAMPSGATLAFVFIYENPKLREPKLCCYMQNAGGFCMNDSMKDLGHFYRFILLKNLSFLDVRISTHEFVAFFQVVSLMSTGFDNEKVGVENKKVG